MTGEVQRWADVAMWSAEPMGDGTTPVTPKVTLLGMTDSPLAVIAAAAEMYQGRIVRDYADIDQDTMTRWFRDMTRTKLAAPLELVHFHFLIEGVTRAFTHQLVRQRTAVYVQESMRFAVKEDARWAVALPPSIAAMKLDDPARVAWEHAVKLSSDIYNSLINAGIPAEDARGLLPTNITTRVHYGTNLRALADHAGNRLCTQAQFEWRLVWAQMIEAIREYGACTNLWRIYKHQKWQRELICELFRPVCFQTGKCEFNSGADRYCSIRDRVTVHHSRGDPPSEWSDIMPAEWLLNPEAARIAPGNQ